MFRVPQVEPTLYKYLLIKFLFPSCPQLLTEACAANAAVTLWDAGEPAFLRARGPSLLLVQFLDWRSLSGASATVSSSPREVTGGLHLSLSTCISRQMSPGRIVPLHQRPEHPTRQQVQVQEALPGPSRERTERC